MTENKDRIVITSVGIVSSLGVGMESFWDGVREGTVGIHEIELFNTAPFNLKYAYEIKMTEIIEYIKGKGLRYLDRVTKFLLLAAELALHGRDDYSHMGVVIGTAFGGLHSIFDFERVALKEGPLSVSPIIFPNTVINAPTSRINIQYNMMKLSETISTGMSSGLDAIGYSIRYIKDGFQSILCGGADELSIESFGGMSKANLLYRPDEAPERGYQEFCRPFDRKRKGTVPGEGASVFVLESLETAKRNNRKILGEIIGYGTCFQARQNWERGEATSAPVYAMTSALEDAGIDPSEVDYVCTSANGSILDDSMELRALQNVFGESLQDISVGSIKSMIGECMGASGVMQAVASLMAMQHNTIPPTPNCDVLDEEWGNSITISKDSVEKEVNICLINAFKCAGHNSSLVIKKFLQ